MGRTRNTRLEAVIQELGLSQRQLAARFRAVAAEHGASELQSVAQPYIARWIAGSPIEGRAPYILAETLSRGLGRRITLADIGLAAPAEPEPQPPAWSEDTLTTLVTLGSTDMDINRRRLLTNSVYSLAALAVPEDRWFEQAIDRARARRPLSDYRVTVQDVEAVREMAAFFSRRDQKRGGRAGRTALVAYLRSEVAELLNGRFPTEDIRRGMTSAAAELAYLAGWTAFDAGEHPVAQQWLTIATKLAEEAGDAPWPATSCGPWHTKPSTWENPKKPYDWPKPPSPAAATPRPAGASARCSAWSTPAAWPPPARRKPLLPHCCVPSGTSAVRTRTTTNRTGSSSSPRPASRTRPPPRCATSANFRKPRSSSSAASGHDEPSSPGPIPSPSDTSAPYRLSRGTWTAPATPGARHSTP